MNEFGPALTGVIAVLLIVGGVAVAFNTAPLSGGHLIGGTALVLLGGWLLNRVWTTGGDR